MEPSESTRWLFIAALAGFVIAGRQFLAVVRSERPGKARLALIYAAVTVACFLVLAFFQVQV